MILTKPESSNHTHSTRNSLVKCCPRRQSEWENVLRTFLVKAEIKFRNNFETLPSYLFMKTYIANAIREKCLKSRHFLGRELHFYKFSLLLKIYFIAHDVWRNTQVKWYMMRTPPSFCVLNEFHIATMHSKFCRNCRAHTQGWAGLT